MWITATKTVAVEREYEIDRTTLKAAQAAVKIAEIQFTARKLFGAMARCALLDNNAPSWQVWSEVVSMWARFGGHANNTDQPLTFTPLILAYKDFTVKGMAGTLGAAIGNLYLERLGYPWAMHWEDLANPPAGSPPTKRKPDFLHYNGSDLVVLETKGSFTADLHSISQASCHGYRNQVNPYVGAIADGKTITRGFCVATTAVPGLSAFSVLSRNALAAKTDPTFKPPSPDGSLLRAHFSRVFRLMGLEDVAESVFRGGDLPSTISFSTAEISGEEFWFNAEIDRAAHFALGVLDEHGAQPVHRYMQAIVGLSRKVAESALNLTLSEGFDGPFPRLPQTMNAFVPREDGVALFSDGMAVLLKPNMSASHRVWRR